MTIAKYDFISPYSSPVQVGRLDPSSTKDSSASNGDSTSLLKSSNQTLQKAAEVKNEITSVAKPTVTQSAGLDVYA